MRRLRRRTAALLASLAGRWERVPPAGLVLSLALGFAMPAVAAAAELHAGADLARIAAAVEGAESSGGADPLMWRPEADGPQGPMQVSAAAAADVGGGDRWNPAQNRVLGRAYLALLYRRYGNWPDAVMAYNWGPGSLDLWIKEGRPDGMLLAAVRSYRDRVLRDSGLAANGEDRGGEFGQPLAPFATIANPALRQRFFGNSELIGQLRDHLAAPGSLAALVIAVASEVARRPGYEEFAVLARAKIRPKLPPAVCRTLASILLGKLQAENALLVLLDRFPEPALAKRPRYAVWLARHRG